MDERDCTQDPKWNVTLIHFNCCESDRMGTNVDSDSIRNRTYGHSALSSYEKTDAQGVGWSNQYRNRGGTLLRFNSLGLR